MIFKNTNLSLASIIVPALISIPSIGVLSRNLGLEIYGIFSLLFLSVSLLGVLDLGLSKTIVVLTSKNVNCKAKKERIFLSSLIFIFLLSFILSVTCYLLLNHFNLNGFSNYIYPISLVLLTIPFVVSTNLLVGYFEAHFRFGAIVVFKTIFVPMTSLLPALVSFLSTQLDHLLYAVLAAKFLTFISISAFLIYSFDINLRSINRSYFKLLAPILAYSKWLGLSNVTTPIFGLADRLVVSENLSSDAISIYSAASDAIQRMIIIPVAFSRVLLPFFATLGVNFRGRKKRNRISAVTFLASSVSILPLLLFSETILVIWLGEEFKDSVLPFQVMLVGLFFNSLSQVNFAYLLSIGKSKQIFLLHVVELFLFLPGVFILFNAFGIIGAAIAWSGRNVIDYFGLLLIRFRSNKNAI